MQRNLDQRRNGALSRRDLLRSGACGFGYLALAGLCSEARARDGRLRAGALAERLPHHTPLAKRVIFLFMQGGPSQVDTFDPKPALEAYDGKKLPFEVARTRKVTPERLFKSPWTFARHGRSGLQVSELFPELARHVDDLCLIRSMHTDGVAHGPATLSLHTGATNLIRPSVGSWVVYGLGTENDSLPGFVTLNPSLRMGGPRNYSSAFLPASFHGTVLGRAGQPSSAIRFRNASNPRLSPVEQRSRFELLRDLNREQLRRQDGPCDELEAVVESFELAFRMQSEAPRALDLESESAATLKLYGIGERPTDDFGRQCLMARRLAEAGVRYIQVNYSDNSNNPRWDQHSNLKKHEEHARAVDRPLAGLLTDLKSRGLLDDTLLWWGGEFGRTPFAQGRDGRDHNPKGFSVWLAGGGVRAGFAYGQTDEFGYNALVDPVHMHDLHATILHILGLDHEKLTFRYAGRDFRLTDVHGRVVHEILA